MKKKRQWSFLMPARDHSFIKWFSAYSYAWLTPNGMTLVAALFVSAGIASPGLHISAYLLTSVVLALLLTALTAAIFVKPKLEVLRKLPTPPSAGDYCIYEVVVTNTTHRPLRDIHIMESTLPYGLYYGYDHAAYDNFIPYLKPQESKSVTLVIHCVKRGMYNLPAFWVGSSYPFNIIRWPWRHDCPDKFAVIPKFVSQAELDIPLHSVYQPGGIVISSSVGESNEFFGTREYRNGDRLRDIHWPSFAHTGKLIVKEYIDEYYARTGLILDTEFTPRRKQKNLEQRISLAAGISDGLAKKGYLVDFFADGDIFYEFQKGNPLTYLDKMLLILAATEGKSKLDFKRLEAGIMKNAHTLSSLILIFKDWDLARSQLCESLKNAGIKMRIFIITDTSLSLLPNQDVTLISSKDKKGLIP